MSVVLLANVGNSDLEIDPKELLPQKPDNKKWLSRELGEEVLNNYNKYKPHIKLPLILPTIDYIAKREGIDAKDIKIYLFASDQQQDKTDASEWQKDTALVAQVIQKYLVEIIGTPEESLTIRHIEGNPADYSNALDFHLKVLKEIRAKEGIDAHYYMEVSGGTPAMTAMLILMGAEVFGQAVSTLYLDRSSKEPNLIDTAQVLFARKTRELLRNQIKLHAYAVALQTFSDNASLIVDNERNRNLIKRLLRYADGRLAFDYERAREELRETHATGNTQVKLRFWYNELREPDSAKIIAELISSAKIKLKIGEYADFTQRLFRFQEATFHYIAEKMGIQYGKDKQYLSNTWLTNNPKLQDYLQKYYRNQKGERTNEPNPVDTNRSLNRYNLGAIVEYFVTYDPQWRHLQPTLDQLFQLSRVADLRNKGIAGHGFEGVSDADIESAYQSPIDELVKNIEGIYRDVFEADVPPNPYDELNKVIFSLLEEV
jgi:hypothetical protein